jgi:hypothetical protein
MKVLHLEPNNEGYKEAELIRTHYSETNRLALIKINQTEYLTGGFIMADSHVVREALDKIPKENQYNFVRFFRFNPYNDKP